MAGAEVDGLDAEGKSALQIAAGKGQLKAISILLDAGAKIDLAIHHGATALHRAAQSGHLNAVLLLLERGPIMNSGADRCGTPLHSAIKGSAQEQGEHLEIARELLKRNVDTNIVDRDGDTALKVAVERQLESFAELLISYGAKLWVE